MKCSCFHCRLYSLKPFEFTLVHLQQPGAVDLQEAQPDIYINSASLIFLSRNKQISLDWVSKSRARRSKKHIVVLHGGRASRGAMTERTSYIAKALTIRAASNRALIPTNQKKPFIRDNDLRTQSFPSKTMLAFHIRIAWFYSVHFSSSMGEDVRQAPLHVNYNIIMWSHKNINLFIV